ncbi:amidase [Alkalicoccus halolimnae]|uniref:Amidase n=1 Tax=Alkalicoccus halolimnae TaxID=1667239 RepID=A0AAJ8LVU9_9BACI
MSIDSVIYTQEDVRMKGSRTGILSGKTFTVKDVFSVEGVTNTAGNPDWFRSHPPAVKTASSLSALLKEGADLKGLTLTDELMYSLHGENIHYGTPENPRDPDRIPGGSSSGSAAAAAAGLVDFALGTDTGGSVRIPAACCGVFGIRPTHGKIPIEGVIPLSPSFDTVGWMSLSSEMLAKVGEVLLPSTMEKPVSLKPIKPEEAWEAADSATASFLAPLVSGAEDISLTHEGSLENWAEIFRIIQAFEIWEAHGSWVNQQQPAFGPGIKERFEAASKVTKEEAEAAHIKKEKIRLLLTDLLADDHMLVMPTSPGPAPLRNLAPETVDHIRKRSFQLCCIAGLAGLPQVSVPVRTPDGFIGLSAVAGPGKDKSLLRWASYMEDMSWNF